MNFPGSWHDVAVSRSLLKVLIDPSLTPHPYRLVADTAFKTTGPISDKILTPEKRSTLSNDPVVRAIQMDSHKACVSVRQAAEWGMRGVQAAFPRLTMRMTTDNARRHMILEIVFRLFNARTRLMKINQIRTVYDPDYLSKVFVQKQYDNLKRYYNIESL